MIRVTSTSPLYLDESAPPLGPDPFPGSPVTMLTKPVYNIMHGKERLSIGIPFRPTIQIPSFIIDKWIICNHSSLQFDKLQTYILLG